MIILRPTTVPAGGTTIGNLRQEAAKLVGSLLAKGTATGGSGTTLIDASTTMSSILWSSLSNGVERFKGGYLLMTGGTAANIGQWRELVDDQPGTGTVQAAKSFPGVIVAGDTYEIYGGISPDMWNDAIQAGLTRCQYLSRSPVTLVIDGDMEASGVGNWIATSGSISKSTSDTVTEGAQSLVLTNSAAGGYVTQAASIPCTPNRSFRMWVDYRVVSAGGETARIKVVNVTTGADIQTWLSPDADTGKSTQGGLISLGFSIPAGCYRMQIYLGGVEATAVIAWDDLILYDTQQFRYILPSWLLSREQYTSLLTRMGNTPLQYEWPEVQWPLDIEEDPTALVTFRCNLPHDALVRPVYLYGQRAYGPIAGISDSSTTACPLEWAKWEVAAAVHEYFSHALSMASLQRQRYDASHCEARCNELRSLYKPSKSARIGFSKPWVGSRPWSMP